jgi:hypothetical protein
MNNNKLELIIESLLLEEIGSPTIAELMQSKIHKAYTVVADDLASLGYFTTEERISLSSAISNALKEFSEEAKRNKAFDKKVRPEHLDKLVMKRGKE